ncbi:MAG: acyl-ACP--UDP-N-acetylglucosamine O-acyltransferase [Kiritimatiellae bacterium]|nr:acyl-ACP--UDP-N-acetylglucosamine O-acyltransferase [Kiritimatiellia bacterium]
MSIHPTAIVHPRAELGNDVEIGPGAVIGPHVVVGDRCRIGPYAVLLEHVRLGPDCRIHAHAVLGDVPQDLKFRGADSHVEIGERCVIREGVTIHRGTHAGSATVIGPGCFLMANSHVAHNCRLGAGVILANGVLLAGDVEIGDRAFLSGNVIVHQFTRIGALAMIGGGAGIGLDILPGCTAAGVERNRVAGLNLVGLRRAGVTPEERQQLRAAFRLVFQSGRPLAEVMERLRTDFTEGLAATWAAFIEGSRRGICRRCRRRREDADEAD